MNNKKLIIFDLDGTLIDSAPDLANAINYMLQELGQKSFSEELINTWVGNGAQTLVKRALLGKKEVDEEVDVLLFEKGLQIFLEHYEENICVNTFLYPKVKETLVHLHKKEYLLSIVTNKPYKFVQPILESLEIENFFHDYIGADSLERKKPDPMPLQYMCDKFSVNIENALMIGDSKNDILAAQALNMHSIGVSYGYNYAEPISVHNPTHIVDDFSKIAELLTGERVEEK